MALGPPMKRTTRTSGAFRQIAVVLRNNSASARSRMIVDVMAAGCVVKDEAVRFEKADDLARLDGRELGSHHTPLYQGRNL